MSGIPKSCSADFAMLVTMEKNQAWIGPMIIGVDRAATMQLVHQCRRDLALFYEIGAGNGPLRVVPHRVNGCEFLRLSSPDARALANS